MIKETVLTSAMVFSGCVPEGADAVTTPLGIIYTETPTADVIEHEECHLERARELGLEFWYKYQTDAEWACTEERRCGVEPTENKELYPRCTEE